MHDDHIRPARNIWPAMGRGALGRCPDCGIGRLFARYLKVADRCGHCAAELHHHRADDAPPYFTIFIVAHIVVPLCLMVERTWRPEVWVHMSLWLPLVVILSLALLPAVKGAIVGLQWALRMHGFELGAIVQPGRTDDAPIVIPAKAGTQGDDLTLLPAAPGFPPARE
jgi:uncharacterized protein (DUF983 family)